MPPLFWYVAAAAGGALVCGVVIALLRAQTWKHHVLHAIAHRLRGGVVDHVRGHGFRARGQLGQLEVTVEMRRDSRRPAESPMWRVLAVGPVRIDQPVEVAAGGWTTDIDPWLERLAPIPVPSGEGPMLAVRAEQPVPFDHPVLAAMRDQGAAITSGALYARPDLMRAEVCVDRHGEAEGLFAYLAAMSDVSERRRTRETGPRSPRTGHVHLVRPLSDGTPPDTVQTG